MNNHSCTVSPLSSSYIVVGVVAFSQGITGLSDLAVNYLYKDDYKMSPSEMTMVQSLVILPWIFKPCWGIISDCIPLKQYRRKSYLIAFGFLSFILWMLMAFVIRIKLIGLLCLFMINVALSFCSVIGEALIVEISQKGILSQDPSQDKGSAQIQAAKNVSYFFGIKSFGTLLVSYLGGSLLETYSKQTVFAITSIFPLTVVGASFLLDEDKVERNERILITVKNQIAEVWTFMCHPAILQPILFILSYMMMPSSGSAMFYFYTNVLGFRPEFMGQLRFIYAVGSILANITYNKFLRSVPFKKQFAWTTILSCFMGLSTILLVTRENLKLGLPDKMFTLSDSILIQIMGELNVMPLLVLACTMCPKNIEGTMYALLMSTVNLGSVLGNQLGGSLTYALDITENKFDNLWVLVIATNCLQLLPLLFLGKVDVTGALSVTNSSYSNPNEDEEVKKQNDCVNQSVHEQTQDHNNHEQIQEQNNHEQTQEHYSSSQTQQDDITSLIDHSFKQQNYSGL